MTIHRLSMDVRRYQLAMKGNLGFDSLCVQIAPVPSKSDATPGPGKT